MAACNAKRSFSTILQKREDCEQSKWKHHQIIILCVRTVPCNTALSMHKNTNIQQCSIDFSLNYSITILPKRYHCVRSCWDYHALQAEDLWPVCFLLRPYSAHVTEKQLLEVLTRASKSKVNNCIAKWRLGACDTQELPLLAASFPRLGNPGNPAKSPHVAGKKADTRHTENISGKGEGRNHL